MRDFSVDLAEPGDMCTTFCGEPATIYVRALRVNAPGGKEYRQTLKRCAFHAHKLLERHARTDPSAFMAERSLSLLAPPPDPSVTREVNE